MTDLFIARSPGLYYTVSHLGSDEELLFDGKTRRLRPVRTLRPAVELPPPPCCAALAFGPRWAHHPCAAVASSHHLIR